MIGTVYESFPNYTETMYNGDQPTGKGHEHVNGSYCDRWECRYGSGESYKGELLHASFSLNHKITIYIVYSVLWIVDFRHSGKTDVWEYSSDPCSLQMTNIQECHRHQLESERIEKILSTKIDSVFWHMVQKRAKEIYTERGDML